MKAKKAKQQPRKTAKFRKAVAALPFKKGDYVEAYEGFEGRHKIRGTVKSFDLHYEGIWVEFEFRRDAPFTYGFWADRFIRKYSKAYLRRLAKGDI